MTTSAAFNEANSVQQPIVDLLEEGGWAYKDGASLPRGFDQVFLESELAAALVRLNPVIAAVPTRAADVIATLRTLTLKAGQDGLVQANAKFSDWLRGEQAMAFSGHPYHEPVRLIDFEHPENNRYLVADEVTYGPGVKKSRFDIVLWVNGIPLVVGETKTNTSAAVSWVKGAKDIHDVYERKAPAFFVPNVLSFASDGKEFFYGAVRQPIDKWSQWGSMDSAATLGGWPRVKQSVELLLSPFQVLAMLSDFTLYEKSDRDGVAQFFKILARYPQVHAADAIYNRVLEPGGKQGLIQHTQGSGKTLAMVFAAGKLMKTRAMKNPTVIVIADRTQLVTQSADQFRTTNDGGIATPETARELQEMLRRDDRGVIASTVHKFKDAGVLSTRDNIIVLIDEAHRTQEGDLGNKMRESLPNARFFGFTGTPISDGDKNTFKLYGDPKDPGFALSVYDSDRSIADGTTVPMHVDPRMVTVHIDKATIDAEFEKMAAEQNLDDEQKDFIASKISTLAVIVSNPERIKAVCTDIIDHFYSVVDPQGMKAQVVVYNRAMCAAYEEELTSQLIARAAGGTPDEAAVVMTVGGKADGGADYSKYELDQAAEAALLRRFRNFNDPLKFLIVTSKLGTGFNADNEGVMYMDKPLRLHTLYQTITRTNRTWKNPVTGKEKKYGLIVDYFGIGDEFAKAMYPTDPERARKKIEVDGLVEEFAEQLDDTLARFVGIDRTVADHATLQAAFERIPEGKFRDRFAVQFGTLSGVWELLWPDSRLDQYKDDYKWLAKVYDASRPSSGGYDLLWEQLGTKTLAMVHSNMTSQGVLNIGMTAVIAEEDTLEKLKDAGIFPPKKEGETQPEVSLEDVVDGISARIKKRLAGANGDHPVYKSLAERLERIRLSAFTRSQDSVDYLSQIFVLAADLTNAETAEDEEGEAGLDVLDPNVGALTQIFEEYKPAGVPVIIGEVVRDIDAIVKAVSFSGWSETQRGDKIVRLEVRKVLKRYELHRVEGLFDHAYNYIAANY
ncbi:type I restriction endonuclease subunit R [Arthrobacter sp. STN4]|uniref:type I restriction endonuclease subunit R n=1 Tax=Arthrobacter sp. STN4 TaxID=2923276 RepID=UPI00211A400F|nr:HsdR family type I site-specific deoxyribonuclease [Arthrobacter sp. STN4]MCQ9162973.1 HsdR family type I site-specific deoxyribonuclease [Arthrobacter sp. STN4]